jgi:two-component sensor histidine kinase
MKPTSLSSRLFVVTAVALAPAFIVTGYSLLTLLDAQKDDLHSEARRIAELVSLELEQTVAATDGVLRTIGAAPIVKRGQQPDCDALLDEVAREVDYMAAIEVLNLDGSVRCRTGSPPPPLHGAVTDDILTSPGTIDRLVGRVMPQDNPAKIVLPISLRLHDADGRTTGAAVGYLDLDWLEGRLQDRSLTPGNSLTIADQGGTIIARVPEPERFVGTVIPSPYIDLVRAAAPGSIEVVSQDGTNRILGYHPPAANNSGLYISAGLSQAEGYATFRSVAFRAALLSFLGILGTGAFAYYTARAFVARPVQRLIDTVAAWRNGDETARTGLDANEGEICRAGQSVDAFMDELLATREARRKADEARDLMRDELEHREKNLMATVQAIARQTFSKAGDEAAYRVFSDRLNAIGTANGLLKRSSWQSTPLHELVAETVATFVGKEQRRVSAAGPEVLIKASVATVLAMSIHELCTNAVKYGALSNDVGTIDIAWHLSGLTKDSSFILSWVERGGPPVKEPRRTGFGSKVIRDALSGQTSGTVEITHDPLGLCFRLTAPAGAILAMPSIEEQPVAHASPAPQIRPAEA